MTHERRRLLAFETLADTVKNFSSPSLRKYELDECALVCTMRHSVREN